jgi:hypothetical protein
MEYRLTASDLVRDCPFLQIHNSEVNSEIGRNPTFFLETTEKKMPEEESEGIKSYNALLQ